MLTHFQDALVALAADARVRGRFRDDPAATLARFTLSERERATLLSVPLDALERFAASLLSKRWHEVARVVPLTARVSPKLGERYRAWLATDPARAHDTVLPPGVDEALRALASLRADTAKDGAEAPYAPDLLAFEVLGAASRADGAVRFLTSRYRVDLVAGEVRRGLLPVDPDLSPTQLRFDRAGVKWRAAP
jgi:hypothetical protein